MNSPNFIDRSVSFCYSYPSYGGYYASRIRYYLCKRHSGNISLVTDQIEQQFDKAINAGAISIVKPTQKPWGDNSSPM